MRRAGSSRDNGRDEQERSHKRKKGCQNGVDFTDENQSSQQDIVQRRVLRSKYLAVINKINDERDDLSRADSDKFNRIFNEVENLHLQVQKPREQVADAEALLDIATTLVSSVKSQSNEGITPADFVSCLITKFGESNGRTLDSPDDDQLMSVNWKGIGLSVSPILSVCNGCCTMLGPMSTEIKLRKPVVRKRRERPIQSARPEEVDDSGAERKTDTDNNMITMFEILKIKKRVRLESLVLNKISFAQTVENLFALSFLVKDGRAEITVNENGFTLVEPKNAPDADSVTKGKVAYSHFVFRLDFKDWKLMMKLVENGEELMPHRERSEANKSPGGGEATMHTTTPIRKLSRNRGRVLQEQTVVVEDTPQVDDEVDTKPPIGIRRCKRKLI